jgi:diguanylate cyclase (GGDEF)-like protein/PAS domain S-box-containing protein
MRDGAVILLTVTLAWLDMVTPPYVYMVGYYFIPLFAAMWFCNRATKIIIFTISVGTTIEQSYATVPAGSSVFLYIVLCVSFLSLFIAYSVALFRLKMSFEGMRRANQDLQLAASVFEHAEEGIVITDTLGTIIEVNGAFSRITGYSRAEAVGQNPRILKSGRHAKEFYTDMWRALLERGHWRGEIWNRNKRGEIHAGMLTISAVRNRERNAGNYVALFSDITAIKEHQRQLEYLAHFDSLTKLPNRVLLADRLRQGITQSDRRDRSLAVGYLDLDGFKEVNDQHGHDVGDQLLVGISKRMTSVLREGDTLARVGGDEFVVVLADLEHPRDYEVALGRLLRAAGDPLTVNNVALNISASIGVTVYPQDKGDADLLLRHADQAMYLAKQAGKNCYHLFDVNHDAVVKARRETVDDISRAFERREFVLHYQPKVNMKTGKVVGAEALIRWQHPQQGLLPPAVFLPVIEDLPISVRLGEWVIDAALTQVAEWRTAGLDMPVSVNVGSRQLQQADFTKRLAALLAQHPAVPPSLLELEILETSALADIGVITKLMQFCQEIGVRFALDDFGTGYSSLAYLRHLPAEVLKIDQTFVRDMLVDKGDLAIIAGIVGLARAFKRVVIAEGVETVAHGKQLLELGCELAQGYGIARPMPPAEMPGWVAAWRPDAAWVG